jgi:RimJ/RimL family protein N-acetyltransferase
MELFLLTEELAHAVAPWFDDAKTIRYLGNRDWLYRELRLMQTAPGSEFKGRRVLARYVWVLQDQNGQPCGLVDVEPYDDGTAGMAFLIAPDHRGQRLGQHILRLMEIRPELQSSQMIVGGVEPENIAAQRCLERVGYTIVPTPDEEGFLRFYKRL